MGRHAASPPAGDPARQEPEARPQEWRQEQVAPPLVPQRQVSPAVPTSPAVPAPSAEPAAPSATPQESHDDAGGWRREALVFGLAVAGATGGVLVWAMGIWWVALLGALGAAAVVAAATWVARSVPGPDSPSAGAPRVDR